MYRNLLLLAASLLFYAWGEPVYIGLMLISILFNWGVGLAMSSARSRRIKFGILSLAVAINLMVLAHYEYTSFLVSIVNELLGPLLHRTFRDKSLAAACRHLILRSTLFPIWWTSIAAKRSVEKPTRHGAHISMFPQLVAR